MMRKMSDWLVPSAAVAATIAGIVGVLRKLAIDVPATETAISIASAVASVIAGLFSVYIARAMKSLVRAQRIFISYSRDEKDVARRLRAALVRGGAKVWFDENELQPGDNLKASIATAIESSNTVVAVLSNTLGAHLRDELRTAVERHVPIFTVVQSGRLISDELVAASERVLFINEQMDVDQVAADVLASKNDHGATAAGRTEVRSNLDGSGH